MNWILDTCVISEFSKARPSSQVIDWIEGCDEETLFMSVLTIGELARGIARLPKSTRRAGLEHWLHAEIVPKFADRVLPITDRIATLWGQASGAADAKGRPVPTVDGLIAATAVIHDCTVVTRNRQDFEHSGARYFDPWSNQ